MRMTEEEEEFSEELAKLTPYLVLFTFSLHFTSSSVKKDHCFMLFKKLRSSLSQQ